MPTTGLLVALAAKGCRPAYDVRVYFNSIGGGEASSALTGVTQQIASD